MLHPTDSVISTLIFALILFVTFSAFTIFMIRRFQVLRAAVPIDRFSNVKERLSGLLRFFIGQGRILNPKYIGAGIMHAVIFWGFLAVTINSIHFIGRGFVENWSLPLFGPGKFLDSVYLPFVDLFEVGVLLMVIWAGIRRAIIKPKRVTNSWDAALILGLIGSLMFTDILIPGAEAT
ncbi:(Fe-S)-binding protein, partial [Candidatus Marinimicrobia bacterium MT.SAG.3]